jgi:hypothetical protein
MRPAAENCTLPVVSRQVPVEIGNVGKWEGNGASKEKDKPQPSLRDSRRQIKEDEQQNKTRPR